MDWVQFAILFLTLVGFIWTSRQETKEIHKEIKDFHKEIKDFHGRLCALEEKYIQMMEKYWESKK